MASLDPDPSWEYGFRIWILDSQNVVRKEKKIGDFKSKKALTNLPKAFSSAWESLSKGL